MLPPDQLLETFQSTYISFHFFQFSRIKKIGFIQIEGHT